MFATYNRLGLHVSASPRRVIRAARGVIARNKLGRKHAANRKNFYRRILQEHKDAGDLYLYAMGSIR